MSVSERSAYPAPVSRHYVVGGRRLHLWDWGEPGAEPILLLHGGGHNAHTWDRVCPVLAAGYRCLAVDLRGHGDSEWSYECRYTVPDYQDDLAGLLDALAYERVTLIGMSLGGIVSLSHALAQPDRVAALILVDVIPRCNLALPHRIVERIDAFERLVEESASLDEAVERVSRRFPHKSSDRLRESIVQGATRCAAGTLVWKRDRRRPVDVQVIADHLLALDSRARAVHCPALVVKGGDSPAFEEAAGREFVSRLRRGEFVSIKGAGHAVQEDQPAVLTAAIRRFMKNRAREIGYNAARQV